MPLAAALRCVSMPTKESLRHRVGLHQGIVALPLFPPWATVSVAAPQAHGDRTARAKFLHCVHTAHAEAGILTQEYLSPVWGVGDSLKTL